MIIVSKTPISTQQHHDLQNWAKSSSGQLFRKVCAHRLADMQAQIGRLVANDDTINSPEMERLKNEASNMRIALDVMERFTHPDTELYLCNLGAKEV